MIRIVAKVLTLILASALVSVAFADVVFVSMDAIRADADALPETGVVSTGQPDAMALQSAADAGYVAVVDLRTEGEERGIDEEAEVTAVGMQYISIPISGSTGLTFENAAALENTLADIDGPVLLHCGSGNRAGALVALTAKSRGASNEEAIEAGRAAGMTRSEAPVRELIEAQ